VYQPQLYYSRTYPLLQDLNPDTQSIYNSEISIGRLLSEYQSSDDDSRKNQIASEISTLVKQQFERKINLESQQVQQAQSQFEALRKTVDKRQANKEKIIADRVTSLLQKVDGTGWDYFPQPSTSAIPIYPTPAPIQPLPSFSMPPTLTPPTQGPNEWLQPPSPPQPRLIPPIGNSSANSNPLAPRAPEPNDPTRLSQPSYPKAMVSYDDFKELVTEVESHRKDRVVNLDQFIEMSKQPNVIVLDTRSSFRFERIHIKGAKHLAFTDFTEANLKGTIPSPDTTILIYCNNNFTGNQVDFASKSAPPLRRRTNPIQSQIVSQERPVQLALNIPTYINLYGYGYRNVYELGELVNVNDKRIAFEGSVVSDESTKTDNPK
jgi:rhodanese-related sulfurtransferase